ncbi:MAG: NAD-dependent epimerase/dehydratase family protein [Candidatus Thorarchaeota archaeon]
MNILVTGATGFIGKNLVGSLVKKNHKVICLIRKTSKKADIDYLKKIKVQLFYGDITKKENLSDSFNNIDVIYHLAGILGDFNTSKEDYYKTHVQGTKNLLKFCKNQKFIYCSSAGVLGPVINGDELRKVNPTNVYEKTKAEAEKLVLEYNNYAILRPEFVYGSYDLHVLNLFRAIKNRNFYIIGDGSNMLHPTYVDDLIFCLIKCLDKKIKNEIFMVAGEKPVSVEEFIKLVSSQLNVKTNKIKIPL